MLPPDVIQQLQRQHALDKKIVLVTGVFDLLHEEHRRFLRAAKAVGDFLIVGVESDVRVRQIKGEGRPIQTASQRVEAIVSTRLADAVFILPEQFSQPADHEALLALVRPAVLAVSEHTAHLEKKRALVQKYGGELQVVLAHNLEISTTQLLQQRATPR